MKFRRFLLACCTLALPALAFTNEPLVSHFECKDFGNSRYRPYYLKAIHGSQYQDFSLTPKGLLGQNAMKSVDECERALEAANHEFGVICSRTGLDGWKPTLYTGTVPGRPDFGYLGGSSIMRFEDCLTATRHSSQKECVFGEAPLGTYRPLITKGSSRAPSHLLRTVHKRPQASRTKTVNNPK